MIQRKQTLFLLAVLIISVIMFFLPFQSIFIPNDITFNLSLLRDSRAFGYTFSNSNIYWPLLLNALIIVLSFFAIFLYKKRPVQYKIAYLIVLVNVIITGLFFLLNYIGIGFYYGKHLEHFKKIYEEEISYKIGAFLPIISAIFALLAAHFIKKDEQLVRNSDRIR